MEWSQGTDWFYFDPLKGNMLTGWQYLNRDEVENWFYFDPLNGDLYQDRCTIIDNKQYCFDSSGLCYEGCQNKKG